MTARAEGHIELDDITVDASDNIRDHLTNIDELAETIRSVGLLAPLIVETVPEGGYLLVAGHRRYAAARKVGLKRVACSVIPGPLDAADRLMYMLIENVHREELTPLEEARAYGRLSENGLTQRDIAERVGRTQSHISRRIMLLDLTQADQERLATGAITIERAVDRARGSTPPPAAPPRPWRERVTPAHRQPIPGQADSGDDESAVPQLVVTLTEKEHAALIRAAKTTNVRPEALARRLIQQYLKVTAG